MVWERVNQATATCVARPAMDGPLTGQPGIFQLSLCKLCGGSQAVPFQVILEISLISEGLRSRYTTSTFFPIRVISVWQQLHTRESSRTSLSPFRWHQSDASAAGYYSFFPWFFHPAILQGIDHCRPEESRHNRVHMQTDHRSARRLSLIPL